jgi:hypothetical protein
MRTIVHAVLGAALLWPVCAAAQVQQHHHGGAQGCSEPTLACATKVTPTFTPDGSLLVAFAAGGRVLVARSSDLGQTFTPPVAVNAEPLRLDSGPDARPKIVVDREGRIVVAFGTFKDDAFNGQVFYAQSLDGGATFAAPRPVTADPESQRFETIALDTDGSVFVAWLDKRNRRPAAQRGETYPGAALVTAWSKDSGATVSQERLACDNTCECCRIGVAFAGPGRPVVLFRNIFAGGVRDHAVVTFSDHATPGPLRRVSVDDWRIDACPHHGPSLTIAADGTYHVAWYTNGRARSGLFYAHSADGGETFSAPMAIGAADRRPSNPALLATRRGLWLAWKEFDGEETSIKAMVSRDGGATWTAPTMVARTAQASDHPLLTGNGHQVFVSWMSQADGYRLIPFEDAP